MSLDGSLFEILDCAPPIPADVTDLIINITNCQHGAFRLINNYLYVLATTSSDLHLKRVRVYLGNQKQHHDDHAHEIWALTLWPLAQMSPDVELLLHSLPKFIELVVTRRRLEALVKRQPPALAAFQDAKNTMDQIHSLVLKAGLSIPEGLDYGRDEYRYLWRRWITIDEDQDMRTAAWNLDRLSRSSEAIDLLKQAEERFQKMGDDLEAQRLSLG